MRCLMIATMLLPGLAMAADWEPLRRDDAAAQCGAPHGDDGNRLQLVAVAMGGDRALVDIDIPEDHDRSPIAHAGAASAASRLASSVLIGRGSIRRADPA